jgi:uncharacterized protein
MKTPLELLQALLANPTNIEHVRGLTTEDVTYVSLNFENPELHKVLPWAGTNRGPQSIVNAFNGIGRVWETKAFEVRDVLANEKSVAMFGSFTYKTRTLGKEITSPFALLTRATGDKSAMFGSWRILSALLAPFVRPGYRTSVASQPPTKLALVLECNATIPHLRPRRPVLQ